MYFVCRRRYRKTFGTRRATDPACSADLLGPCPELFHGTQRPADHPPGNQRKSSEQQWKRNEQGVSQRRTRGEHVAIRQCDDDADPCVRMSSLDSADPQWPRDPEPYTIDDDCLAAERRREFTRPQQRCQSISCYRTA